MDEGIFATPQAPIKYDDWMLELMPKKWATEKQAAYFSYILFLREDKILELILIDRTLFARSLLFPHLSGRPFVRKKCDSFARVVEMLTAYVNLFNDRNEQRELYGPPKPSKLSNKPDVGAWSCAMSTPFVMSMTNKELVNFNTSDTLPGLKIRKAREICLAGAKQFGGWSGA